MGNSEVGHLNIGAGRVVKQELVRIGDAVADGSIAKTAGVHRAGRCAEAIRRHLPPDRAGLAGRRPFAPGPRRGLAGYLHKAGIKTVVHAITDGRDTPPQSGGRGPGAPAGGTAGGVPIATVVGRYFAMDRDKRWDRVAQAYAAIAEAEGARFATPEAAIEAAYAAEKFDEFVPASVIGDYAGMQDGDAILCFNFRADRVREILAALARPGVRRLPPQARR